MQKRPPSRERRYLEIPRVARLLRGTDRLRRLAGPRAEPRMLGPEHATALLGQREARRRSCGQLRRRLRSGRFRCGRGHRPLAYPATLTVHKMTSVASSTQLTVNQSESAAILSRLASKNGSIQIPAAR